MDAGVEVFETEAMQYVIQYMAKYAMYPYNILVSTYFAMLLSFSFAHIVRLNYIVDFVTYSWLYPVSISLFAVSLLFCARLINLESKVMQRQGFEEYAESGWNSLQMCAYFLVILSSVVSFVHDTILLSSDGTSITAESNVAFFAYNNVLGAIAMVMAWSSCLSYLRGYTMFASIIATLMQILEDMQGFFLLLVILTLGGVAAFKVLLPGAEIFYNFHALVTVWTMVNGEVDLDSMEVSAATKDASGNETEAVNGVTSMIDSTHADVTYVFATVLALAFGFLMLMVLMNQLIALMADSYNHVMENLFVETLRSRAEVIIDVKFTYGENFLYWLRHKMPRNPCKRKYDTSEETLLKNVQREFLLDKDKDSDHIKVPAQEDMVRNCLHPRWLHVLRPRSANNANVGNGGWEGSLKTMKSHIGFCKADVQSLSDRFDASQLRMDAKMSHVLRLLIASSGGGEAEELGRDKMLRANRKLGMFRVAQLTKLGGGKVSMNKAVKIKQKSMQGKRK